MKNYPHIIAKVFGEPWLITKERHLAIQRLLESRMDAQGEGETIVDVLEEEEDIPKDYMPMDGSTAIIPVSGIIGKHLSSLEMMCGGCDLDHVGSMIDAAIEDDGVSRLLLNFNSPGGTVTGVPEMSRKIANLSKPTIAFTDSQCCSAGYWLASQCKQFYCTESADVGSIGVYMAMLDYSRQMENDGVKMNAISAGKYKLAGAWFKPMTDEERNMFQADVDKLHSMFKGAVTRYREVPESAMEGQCFMGDQAVALGLVDGLVEDISEVLDA